MKKLYLLVFLGILPCMAQPDAGVAMMPQIPNYMAEPEPAPDSLSGVTKNLHRELGQVEDRLNAARSAIIEATEELHDVKRASGAPVDEDYLDIDDEKTVRPIHLQALEPAKSSAIDLFSTPEGAPLSELINSFAETKKAIQDSEERLQDVMQSDEPIVAALPSEDPIDHISPEEDEIAEDTEELTKEAEEEMEERIDIEKELIEEGPMEEESAEEEPEETEEDEMIPSAEDEIAEDTEEPAEEAEEEMEEEIDREEELIEEEPMEETKTVEKSAMTEGEQAIHGLLHD